MLGSDLIPARMILAKNDTAGGDKLEAAKADIGNAITNRRPLPQMLFFTVSTIPVQAIEQKNPTFFSQTGYALASSTDQSGGSRLS